MGEEFIKDGKFAGSRYTVRLPEALVTDEYYSLTGAANQGLTGKLPAADVTAYETAYSDGSTNVSATTDQNKDALYLAAARTGKRGITSGAVTFQAEVTQKIESAVPQTSVVESAVSYDANKNELVVLFTGTPTDASLRDLNNYFINGTSIAQLGGNALDVVVNKIAEGATEPVMYTGGPVANYEVRIAVPKNSIANDGPARVTVQDIQHADGGKMALVEIKAVPGFKDNTSPKITKAEINAGSGDVILTFDENIAFVVAAASAESAERNFTITIDGTTQVVTGLIKDANQVTLSTTARNINPNADVRVEFKLNPEGSMEIGDMAGNPVDPALRENSNIRPVKVGL